MSDSFINRYRPQEFSQVYGHEAVLGPLQRLLAEPRHAHTYLITGPSGVGKTTVARLIGLTLGAVVTEIDAASHSGVDDMREVVELSQYLSLQGSGNCMYIIDECHTLSRNAWQALLKVAEEPPEHFYLALCTTEPDKVPATIKMQRAYQVSLRPIPPAIMMSYVGDICAAEDWRPHEDVFTFIVQHAEGSPRKALQLLLAVSHAPDREAAQQIFSEASAGDAMTQVCQLFLRGKPTWASLKPHLARIEDDAYEAALSHLGGYLVSALIRTEDARIAARCGELILALTFPTETYNKKLQFYAAMVRMLQA